LGHQIKKNERDEHVAQMEERRGAYRVLVGNLRGKAHVEDMDVDGRITLKWIFKVWDADMNWTNLAQDSDWR
jgi:hypothetical protein